MNGDEIQTLREELAEKAVEVAALLNAIVDDDDREAAQVEYERRLNDELYTGSMERLARARDEQIAKLTELLPIRRHSRVRVDDGREGVVVGFHTQRLWSFRRPSVLTWPVVLLDDGGRGPFAPGRLTVIQPAEGAKI